MNDVSEGPALQRIHQSPGYRLRLVAFAAWPALVLIWTILAYGVNLAVMDEWSPTMAGLYIKAHHGQLALSDFLSQHNEHRMIVPRLIFFALGSLTHMNKVVEMVGSWVLACLMSVGLLRIILQTSQRGSPAYLSSRFTIRTATIWLICNLFVFTPDGWENWLTGFGLSNVLPTATFVGIAVVAIMDLGFWTKVGLSTVLAMAATWSTGNGLLAWPMAGVLLAWSESVREFKRKVPALAALLAVFAINMLVYVTTYHQPPPNIETPIPPATLGQILPYNLIFMGNAFSYVVNLPLYTFAAAAGILYFLTVLGSSGYLIFVWRRYGDTDVAGRILVWLALAGVSVFNGVIASLFRAGLGTDQAASSRYLIHSLYLPIAVVNLVPLICDDFQSRFAATGQSSAKGPMAFLVPIAAKAPLFLGGIMLFLSVLMLSPGIYRSEHTFRLRRNAKASLLMANVVSDLSRIHDLISPEPQKTVEMARELNAFGFIQPPLIASNNATLIKDPAHTQTRGRLEKYWQSGFEQVSISGWACAPGTWRAADAVFLTYDDENANPIIFAMAVPVEERNDLVQQGGVGALVHAGWQLDLPFNQFPPTRGAARIRAWVLDVDTAKAVLLDGEAVLSINRGL